MDANRVLRSGLAVTIAAAIVALAVPGSGTAGGPITESGGTSTPAMSRAPLPQTRSVDEIVEQLDSPDATERAVAACRLGRMDADAVGRARDRLLELLSDGAEVEGPLCRERQSRWSQRRSEPSSPGREAAIALEELGSPVVDRLADVLEGEDAVGRENAAFALGLVESFPAVAPLLEALGRDRVAAVRARAAWALGMIEDRGAVEGLSTAVGDDDEEVREQAAWALGMIESAAGVEPLLTALDDEVADVREQAAWALGMIESSDAVEGLVRVLREDGSAEVREQAAWALGMIESADAVEGLVRVLREDGSAEVREQAAWALGMIEDPGATEALVAALEDEDPDVREQAMWALSMVVGSEGFGDIDRSDLADALRRAREREP